VLTRELLIFRRVKGNLRPTFIDARDELHLALAASLIEIFEHGIGETRGTLDEALDVLVGEAKKQKLARGLVKLLQDRCGFEEAGDAASSLRRQAFVASAATLRALPDDASLDLYLERLSPALPLPLDDCRIQLYADPLRAPQTPHPRAPDPAGPARALQPRPRPRASPSTPSASASAPPPRASSSCASCCAGSSGAASSPRVHREDDEWVLTVEGPGAMFDMQKKYGLQLATFLAAVPLLSKYTLAAEVDVPRGAKGTMVLDHKDPLRAPRPERPRPHPAGDRGRHGRARRRALDLRGTPRAAPHRRDRHVRPPTSASATATPARASSSSCSTAGTATPSCVASASCTPRPDPELVLGIDLSLLKPGKDGKDDDLAARVHDHPQVFTFNKFPSRRRLQPILDRVAAEALTKPRKPATKSVAEPVAEPRTKPRKPVAEPVAEAVAEALTKPVAEPLRKPRKPATKPVAEALTKPVAEALTEPVTKPRKPAAKPATSADPPAPGAAAGTARRRRAT
jgi:hypothetical protein